MIKKKVLVTGANGQLGTCLRNLEPEYPLIHFIFKDSKSLDISNQEQVNTFFSDNKFDWVINCAAYTAVDKAETDPEMAYKVNRTGAKNIAIACSKFNVELIHISTDFVFDGNKAEPYNETDKTNPLGVYGKSKLDGEIEIQTATNKYFIIRTSWLYSEFGKNFFKTMLALAENKNQINVIFDQVGTPTYAGDLAEAIMKIISTNSAEFGVYHYSNEGVASWYDFAKEIFDNIPLNIMVYPIKTEQYPTPAKRPPYSVLDKAKFKETFHVDVPYWKVSLKKVIENI